MTAAFQTEYAFTLPCGYVDERGNLHREGVMRRATTLDEIEPLRDPRVRAHDAYLSVVLLSRVVTQLGSLPALSPERIEQLFATDFVYLQQLYLQINESPNAVVATRCPVCGTHFALDLAGDHEGEQLD
ncbi:MAG: phage tail assembly protein [Roseiflexaceae bacterium]|nr:phage tail assembly protein [Roseiflexaceae bacterium]